MTMIKKIVLTTPMTSINLPVFDAAPSDQFILKSADGLGPPEIDISMGEGLAQGGIYQGSSPQDREIVLLVSLNPSYSPNLVSPADLRALLYSGLAGQFTTKVSIYTDSVDLSTSFVPSLMTVDGYVKRIEINPFSKEPEAQVTIRCPISWFEGPKVSSAGAPLPVPLLYNGTAPTGLLWGFITGVATTALVIENDYGSKSVEKIIVNKPLASGSHIEFVSTPGKRKLQLVDGGGGAQDLIGYSTFYNNIWPSLRPGSNPWRLYENFGANIPYTTLSYIYTKQYWGV